MSWGKQRNLRCIGYGFYVFVVLETKSMKKKNEIVIFICFNFCARMIFEISAKNFLLFLKIETIYDHNNFKL